MPQNCKRAYNQSSHENVWIRTIDEQGLMYFSYGKYIFCILESCISLIRLCGEKCDHVLYEQGIPAQLVQRCITYSLRLLENINIPPGSAQQKHL